MKIEVFGSDTGSESGSGSISQNHGSADLSGTLLAIYTRFANSSLSHLLTLTTRSSVQQFNTASLESSQPDLQTVHYQTL
jgi:hypothetical protein